MSEEILEHKIDKSSWEKGPWHNEPDKVLWKHLDFDCMIVRNNSGALCGYVGVYENHPWFGKPYDDINARVHGGLTYSNYCQGHICHPSPEKTYWIGFDCAHGGDKSPAYDRFNLEDVTYKDLSYVTNEVNQLAEQAKATLGA